MTTYGVDVQVETQTKRPLKIDTSPGGKISRTTRTNNTGNYGNNSSYRPPQSATQARRIDGSGNYGNPMRTHVNVTATEVPGSKRQTLGNRARVASSNASTGLGKAAKTAGKAAKTVGGRISPGIGINAKGDIDFGLRAGGAGLSISGKGDISLGVPGLSATINPKNPSDTTVDIGFGAVTIEQTRVGCSITVTIRMGGKIINQDTRKADDCVEPEPTPTPTPSPTPSPSPTPTPSPNPVPEPEQNTDDLSVPSPKSFTVPTGSVGWVCPMIAEYRTWNTSVHFVERLLDDNGNPWYDAYEYRTTQNITWKIAGWTQHGGIYDLGLEDLGKSKQSGTGFAMDFYIDDGKQYAAGLTGPPNTFEQAWGGIYTDVGSPPPKPYKSNGWKLSQFVPAIIYQMVTYFDRGYAQRYNQIRYTYGVPDSMALEQYRCVEIPYSYEPNAVKPYQAKPKAIPPMEDEKCCELNKRIYEMLGGDDFFNKGISIPNSIYVPGGKGETQALTYHELNNLLFRTLAYRTPGNIEVKLKDSNIMKEGEQPLTYKATDATSYFNKLMEVTMSQDTDLSALINLIIRLNWIAVQILNISVKINQMSQSIIGFFGVPCKDTTVNVDIPVDPSLGQKVGFEAKKPTIDKIVKLLDLDDPTETRKLLDKFMNFARIPVTVKKLVSTAKGGNYWWLLDKNKR